MSTPPPRAPTLRQLRGFLAVAKHGSFSRAAATLSLTQPALSATVRELENLLGVTLLERSTHHVALTAAGEAMRPQAAWLVNSFDRGVDDLHHALAEQSRSLRIVCLPSAMHLLAQPLARWTRNHPEVRLVVQDPLNEELVEALLRGEADIGLGAELDLPPDLHATTLANDEMVAVLPRGHRLAKRQGPLRWRELRGERIALFGRGSTNELAVATLRQQGVALDDAARLRYSESLYSLVQAGLAVGVISRLYTQGAGAPGLPLRTLAAPAIDRRLALIVRGKPQQLRPLVGECLAYLREALGG